MLLSGIPCEAVDVNRVGGGSVYVTDHRKVKNQMKKCKCCVNLGKVTLCNAHASDYLGKQRAKRLPRNGGKVQVNRRVG